MYSHFLRLCICGIALLSFGSVSAQDSHESGFGVEVNALAGKVVKHTAKFKAPIPFLSTALDANVVWKAYGKRDWEKRRHYPQIGLGITYTNYGDRYIYGSCVGIYPSLQIPIMKGDKVEWTMRIGDGVGYVTRKYQTTAPVDTLNNAIGSHLNDFAIMLMDVRYHINEHWHVQYGINFTHISNGGTETPNLGVNMVGMHVGTTYYPGTCRPKPVEREVPALKNRWLFQVRMDISYKEARAGGNPILPSYMPSAFISKRYNSKNKFYVGADYAFHNDVLAFMRYYGVDNWPGAPGRQRRESWDGTVFAGHEFLVGRVGIVTQLGYYYHQTFLKYAVYNEKIGGNLYLMQRETGFCKEAYISTLMLGHGFAAERIEFGAGFGF